MQLAITKKNAERIFQGMFINRAGLATNELTVPHNLTGIVLFVDDKFVYVDTGKEFCGDTDECLKHVHDGEIPDTAKLKTISHYAHVINDRCHFLNCQRGTAGIGAMLCMPPHMRMEHQPRQSIFVVVQSVGLIKAKIR